MIIATFNIRGIRTPDENNYLWDSIMENKWDMIALQEINTLMIKNPINDYDIGVHHNHETPNCGTAIIHKNTLNVKNVNKSINGKLIKIEFENLTLRNKSFRLEIPSYVKIKDENLLLTDL